MTLQFRRKLFIFFIFIFVILGIAALYYSQGYRLDLTTLSLQKTGAIYIESYQKDLGIFLNGKQYKDKSGLFKKGTLISSVLPKKYRLSLEKEGFQKYEKNIEVPPSEVVRLFNILLVPQNVSSTQIGAYPSSTESILSHRGTQQMLSYDAKQKAYFLYTFGDAPSRINVTTKLAAFTKQKFSSLGLESASPNTLIASSSAQEIELIDLQKGTTSTLYATPHTAFFAQNNTGYLISGNAPKKPSPSPKTAPKSASTTPTTTEPTYPDITIISLDSGTPSYTGRLPLSFLPSELTGISASGNIITFLMTNGDLYIYSTKTGQAQKIAHTAKRALVSPDARKVLFQDTDGKVFIYFIEQEIEALDVQEGDTLRLGIIDAAQIQNVWWHADSFHLILEYPQGKIMLAELTSREPNNHFLITQDEGARFMYSSGDNILLEIKNGTIRAIPLSFEKID